MAKQTTPRAGGPVTLKQARAQVRAAAPVTALKATSTASPVQVGFERRKLELKQEQERRRRIREYKATLEIMKRRGVKGLRGGTGAPAAAAAPRPLQIFAEGDPWFEYPVPFFGGGIIARLEDRLGVPILNLARAGDEVRYMLGVRDRQHIAAQFKNGCPAGGPWDAMLFSGGGNDIVDNPLALWVRDYDPNKPAEGQLHQPRLDAVLAVVQAGYEDLITLRNQLSQNTHLFLHAYDFAIPDGRGVCHLGPWLKPAFDLRGFPSLTTRIAVTKVLLQQFAKMLQALVDVHPRITFINAQGTLSPQTSAWHNELHPAKAGFGAFAKVFHKELKAQFPTLVL